MENFSAAITFMRANPPTTGHFLIVDILHNLDVDRKFIYLSHSQDKKKNPLPYYEKYSFMKTFVEEKYDDVEVVNSDARTLLDALHEVNSKGCNDITIVLGSDRIEEFSALVYKYNGQVSKKTGEIIYQFDNINFVQAGEDRDENSSDELSAISATKQRTLAAEGNFEEFSKGVPTSDPYLKKELYNTLREYIGLEELKEGIFDKISKIIQGEPVEKYYEVGPIVKRWWLKDPNGPAGFLSKEPWRYEVNWAPFSPEDYIGSPIYLMSDFSKEIRENILPIGTPDSILGEKGAEIVDAQYKQIGKYDKVLFSTVKVIYKNEKSYNKVHEKVEKYLIGLASPDDYYNKSERFGDAFTVYNTNWFYEQPTAEDLEKEGFDLNHRVKESLKK